MSELRVTEMHTPTAGRRANGGIQIDANDNVTIGGLNLPQAGAFSNRNLIINGACQVAQRGITSTAQNYGSVDRFQSSFSSGVVTQSQELLTSGASPEPWDQGFRNFFRLTNTTAISVTDSSFRRAMYFVEAQDIANSGWDYENPNSNITISYWVRSSVAQRYFLWVGSADGAAQQFSVPIQDDGGTTLSANTWTRMVHTIPGNANITVNNDNGIGLQLNWIPWFGSDFTDGTVPLNTWEAFDNTGRVPDMSGTWASTAGATFDITGVQLEVGSVATPFEHRSYGDELARCQRYFQTYSHTSLNTFMMNFSGGGQNNFYPFFSSEMRDTPNGILDSSTVSNGTAAVSARNSKDFGLTINSTASGLTFATAYNVNFSAEL